MGWTCASQLSHNPKCWGELKWIIWTSLASLREDLHVSHREVPSVSQLRGGWTTWLSNNTLLLMYSTRPRKKTQTPESSSSLHLSIKTIFLPGRCHWAKSYKPLRCHCLVNIGVFAFLAWTQVCPVKSILDELEWISWCLLWVFSVQMFLYELSSLLSACHQGGFVVRPRHLQHFGVIN